MFERLINENSEFPTSASKRLSTVCPSQIEDFKREAYDAEAIFLIVANRF